MVTVLYDSQRLSFQGFSRRLSSHGLVIVVGDVICVFRIMPVPEKFDSVKKSLEVLKPQRLEEEPIAFGLKALKFTKVIPDASGEIEKLEESLNLIEGVDNVEALTVSRSL